MPPTRASVHVVAALCAVVLASRPAAAEDSPTGIAHHSAFGAPRVNTLDSGTLVLSFDAAGDLRGVVTLTLHACAVAGTYEGEWAFTVAHMDGIDPATGAEPPMHPEGEHAHADVPDDLGEEHEPDHPHRDFVTLVHRGSLAGIVSSAAVVRDADGAVTGLEAALTIHQGASEFQGVTGSGQATLSGLELLF